ANPNGATRTARFQVNDGAAPSNQVSRTITVISINSPPALAGIEGAPLAYAEADPLTQVTASLTVTDADTPNLASATVQTTTGCANPEDVLSFTPVGGLIGNYAAATCTLAISGSSPPASYQTALRSVKYQNTSVNPSTAARIVSFQVDDG